MLFMNDIAAGRSPMVISDFRQLSLRSEFMRSNFLRAEVSPQYAMTTCFEEYISETSLYMPPMLDCCLR